MRCNVCHATTAEGTVCAQCGYDSTQPGASDTAKVLVAREEFKQRTTAFAPTKRVTPRDKLVPWLGLALACVLLIFWLRTCLG